MDACMSLDSQNRPTAEQLVAELTTLMDQANAGDQSLFKATSLVVPNSVRGSSAHQRPQR